ncbi:NDP-hexose 2,3-dehydratase [Streptomyces sp. F-3]|uniref:NDP-hexose 2,3-dehydratase family protein n=1 Tax=Streptomyces thermogriseus TaxID=75292 RepID=A0ABN1T544_9ACTN|nr:NDP-hexose 2,3-dehydratase [Streptomyces sp. F-3]
MTVSAAPSLRPAPVLRPRVAEDLAARLARSAAATGAGRDLRTADVDDWLAQRARAHRFRVERVPLGRLDGWSFADGTGNLVHHTGRFFSVEGLSVTLGEGPVRSWQQPIIRQPEVGILGILAKEFDGVLHFLMQAKMEPGNRNVLQLSPTVQATRSNYSTVHRGAKVKYLEYFTGPRRGQVHADVLQSEHGSWFYRKANRNMLVEVGEDTEAPPDEDFCWLTLGQIGELLRRDNLVNMDARTVIACFPPVHSFPGALLTDAELQSWFTVERSRHDVDIRRIPLDEVEGWTRGEDVVEHTDGRYFRVVGVRVEAGNREVSRWDQPLLEPVGTGVTAFLYRRIGGIPHLLVHAKVEAGFLDTVELAPTVQANPGNWRHLPPEDRPPFLELALDPPAGRVRYAVVHSEEGGRFLNAESRYLFIETDDSQTPLDPPPGYQWATPGQLKALTAHGHYVNVQARTLLSCIDAGAVQL